MNNSSPLPGSPRTSLNTTGKLAAVSALAGVAIPAVHAAGTDVVQVALVGCGGRGTGAAGQALATKGGPIKLVAMADVFPTRLRNSFGQLSRRAADQVEVPQERQFIGLDAYKKAMDCLKKGDVAIFATPPAFRWVHFTYAIEKGLNVFMEKPVTVDGPTTKRMIKLAEAASAKNLKVGVGLMSRHSRHLQQLAKRIQDGEIGDVIHMRGYRMQPGGAALTSTAQGSGQSEMLHQIRSFHSFIWASGGLFSDFYIHIIDHLCWMKGSWPVKAQALGGRHYRQNQRGQPYVDQNFDNYSVEYTFEDGSKFTFDGRCIAGCRDIYASYIHGTKGLAIGSRAGDCGGPSSTYKGQNPKRSEMTWESKTTEGDPYQNEWNDLMDAIRNDKPYNEAKRGAEGSLVTSMGRMAAHTGQEITFDDMLNCEHEMAPGLDKATSDTPAPVMPDANGRYPMPKPGVNKTREY